MRTRILNLKKILFLLLVCTASASQGKSIYFSYNSGANIIFSVYDDKKMGEVTIAGKKIIGTFEKYCAGDNDENIYCFCSEQKEIVKFHKDDKPSFCSDRKQFIFMFDGTNSDNIVILNQEYEIPGASEKYIDLSLINQPDNMELLYPYNGYSDYITDNIPLMNDKAYYLEQAGAYAESIKKKKKVISKSPDRVVAYLNIADAYWGNNEKEEAKKSYEKYVELMKKQGKDMKKIPQRVYDRIKSENTSVK
jgi:tetratricopeptide (TPR) repeat protein